MKIQIEAFGIAKDIFGNKYIELEIEDSIKVAALKELLILKYPALKDLRSLAIAINESYANDQDEIKETDEIVLIPPVSGG